MSIRQIIGKTLFKKAFYGKSMINTKRVVFLGSLLQHVIYQKIKGDIIECGVWRGGSLKAMEHAVIDAHSTKHIYGLDTFEGHPYTDEGTAHIKGHLSDTDYEKVSHQFPQPTPVKLKKGLFADTFPSLKKKTFCFAHLDCDLYQSYKECIEFIYPRMETGGIIYFDDYNSPSAKRSNKAIHEYFKKNELVILPNKQAYYIVTDGKQ